MRLHNASLEALVLTERGGGLAAFNWIGNGGPLPFMRALPVGVTSPQPNRLALYVMVPWSNRIGHGTFSFEGKTFHVAPNCPDEPYPIHGEGWLSSWSVVESTDDALTLELDRSAGSPFAYAAGLSYALRADTLVAELSVENRGVARMPFGLGLHPWFERTPGVRLLAPAEGMWDAGPDVLPIAHVPLPADADFRQAKPLPRRLIDNCFTGWNGMAEIHWDDLGLALRIESSPRLPYYVLFCPVVKPLFCFEPVTHPIDAFNLPDPFARAGLAVLEPGQDLSIRVTFQAFVR